MLNEAVAHLLASKEAEASVENVCLVVATPVPFALMAVVGKLPDDEIATVSTDSNVEELLLTVAIVVERIEFICLKLPEV